MTFIRKKHDARTGVKIIEQAERVLRVIIEQNATYVTLSTRKEAIE